MSGGHFVDNSYPYYLVSRFADELQNEIENNEVPDVGTGWCPKFSAKTLKILQAQLPVIRRAAEVMRAVDYLYAGDHGEESFAKTIKKIP